MILDAEPASGIVKYAHAENASLIIMPTHGYGPFRRLLLGSVTAKVLHDADCPVLTGAHMEHPPVTESVMFRNILCAIDLGPQSEKTVTWAACVAAQLKTQLTIMHAVPVVPGAEFSDIDRSPDATLRKDLEGRIAKLQEQAGSRAAVIIHRGEAIEAICNVVHAKKADLLVIGGHEGAGVRGRLRQHAYAIIRESSCPVVSV